MSRFYNWVAGFVVLLGILMTTEENSDGFVQIKGHQMVLNDALFLADGFNAYWLMSVGFDSSQRFKVTAALKQAKSFGLTLCRTWAFNDGGDSNFSLQIRPGVYNEQMFQGLDFALSEARKYGIRLILSFVNNYNDYGGKKQYVEWAKEKGHNLSDDDFFTNSMVKTFYKEHVKVVLTRVNSITNVPYKDDTTIMSWELMNEPRCTDLSGKIIHHWIEEMGAYVKSLDAKHLLEVGLEGFYGYISSSHRIQYNPLQYQVGTDFIANNIIPTIDFATAHSYPDQWLGNTSSDNEQMDFLKQWVSIHTNDSLKILKKPIMFTEFGKSRHDPNYSTGQRNEMFNFMFTTVEESKKRDGPVVGALFWQLLAHGLDDYRDGNEVVFGEQDSTDKLITNHAKKVHII